MPSISPTPAVCLDEHVWPVGRYLALGQLALGTELRSLDSEAHAEHQAVLSCGSTAPGARLPDSFPGYHRALSVPVPSKGPGHNTDNFPTVPWEMQHLTPHVRLCVCTGGSSTGRDCRDSVLIHHGECKPQINHQTKATLPMRGTEPRKLPYSGTQ